MNVRSSLSACVVALALVLVVGASSARADGAFPDAMRILLPPAQPRAITLATNFGLISTADNGETWTWACETPLSNGGRGYQLAADPTGERLARIVALSFWGLVHSDDVGCTWSAAEGAGKDDAFTDVFVPPSAPATAWAIGIDPGQPSGLAQVLFTSDDGAGTLSGPAFQAPDDNEILGIEPATTAPATVYLTLASGPEAPSLVVTNDGGTHWRVSSLAAAVGPGSLRILAVDTASASTVYLRQGTTSGDRLLITRDGGATWEMALAVTGSLSAFLQQGDGTLLVGVLNPDGSANGYRSSDDGHSFAPWPGVPHLRALAERDGVLYAAADDAVDGFALGVSADRGQTFQPRLRYADVSSVAACVRAECQVTCEQLAGIGLWPSTLCEDGATGGPTRVVPAPSPAAGRTRERATRRVSMPRCHRRRHPGAARSPTRRRLTAATATSPGRCSSPA